MKKKKILTIALIVILSLALIIPMALGFGGNKGDDLGGITGDGNPVEIYPEPGEDDEEEKEYEPNDKFPYKQLVIEDREGELVAVLEDREMDMNDEIMLDYPYAMSLVMDKMLGSDNKIEFIQEESGAVVKFADSVAMEKFYFSDSKYMELYPDDREGARDVAVPDAFTSNVYDSIAKTIKDNYPVQFVRIESYGKVVYERSY